MGGATDRGRGRRGTGEARDGGVAAAGSDLQPPIHPGGTGPAGAPVFYVYQTDVIYYGRNLVDYLRREFLDGRGEVGMPAVRLPVWSALEDGEVDEL